MNKNISDFKPWTVAGFTLCGYKTDKGYELGSNKNEFVEDLPKEIVCNGVTYCLEHVEVFKNNFFNANYC